MALNDISKSGMSYKSIFLPQKKMERNEWGVYLSFNHFFIRNYIDLGGIIIMK